MIKSLAIGLALAGLSSCVTPLDKMMFTEFEPTGPGSYRYVAVANGMAPLDDDGEKIRMQWLGEYLGDNEACPDGYTIESREPVKVTKSLGVQVYDVFYAIHCNQ